MRPATNNRLQTPYHAAPRDLEAEDFEIMHMPPRFWQVRRSLIPETYMCRELLDKFLADVSGFMTSPAGPTLVLFQGGSSSGKTSAAAILARAVRSHHFTVLFLDVPSLPRLFLSDALTADEAQTWRQRAYTTELLVLDGLGRGYESLNYVAAELESLLKHRQDNMLRTLVTTNMAAERILATYGTELLAELNRTMCPIHMPMQWNPAKGALINEP